MESLLLLTKENFSVEKLEKYFDAAKLISVLPGLIDRQKVVSCTIRSCDFSRISDEKYLDLFTSFFPTCDNIGVIFTDLLKSLVTNSETQLSRQKFLSIEFEKFPDDVQQYMLSEMLVGDISIEFICLLLDKMKSVNYGTPEYNKNNINPLIYCSLYNRLDLVKLLVEKYNADIEYTGAATPMSTNKCTAITSAATANNIDIIKYLYFKGANTEGIPRWRTNLWIKISKWDRKSKSMKFDQLKSDYDNLKLEQNESKNKYDQLQSEYNVIKQKLDTICNAINQIPIIN